MTPDFELLNKADLHRLASELLLNDPAAIDNSVAFVLAETKGNWHGRARAMMCRRLKHCPIRKDQQDQLVNCILRRLRSGNFSEQFRDQLRFALAVNRAAVIRAARENLSGSSKDHIKRYSAWILENYSTPMA